MKTGKLAERWKKIFEDTDKKVLPNLLIVLAVGVVLLLLAQGFLKPDNAADNPRPSETLPLPASGMGFEDGPKRPELEVRLEEILSLVEGAGETRVLIHVSQGPERVYARDTTLDESRSVEADANGGTREQNQLRSQSNIVTLNRREGGDEPLMLYENAPRIEGVIIVAEGGGDIIVRDALIRAAGGLLGVAVHKITVLPMAPGKN